MITIRTVIQLSVLHFLTWPKRNKKLSYFYRFLRIKHRPVRRLGPTCSSRGRGPGTTRSRSRRGLEPSLCEIHVYDWCKVGILVANNTELFRDHCIEFFQFTNFDVFFFWQFGFTFTCRSNLFGEFVDHFVGTVFLLFLSFQFLLQSVNITKHICLVFVRLKIQHIFMDFSSFLLTRLSR